MNDKEMSFLSDAEAVIKALNVYFNESKSTQKPVINQTPLADLINDLDLASYVKTGGLTKDRLSEFINKYLASTTRLHHPAYLAHQVAVSHYAGALGALIDGFTNNAMAIYEMGPAAASVEYFIVNWLLEKVGWLQLEIRDKLNTEGSFYISTTLFNGIRYLRLSIMNPDTSLDLIKKLVQRIRELSIA